MAKVSRFSVSMDAQLLESFDQQIKEQGYPNRSNAIADLVRESIVHEKWTEDKEVAAVIIMVFDHHKRDLSNQLNHIQHDYHKIIISSQHVHLDHDNCMEMVIVRGPTPDVKTLADKLKSTKGVNFLSLSAASTGHDI